MPKDHASFCRKAVVVSPAFVVVLFAAWALAVPAEARDRHRGHGHRASKAAPVHSVHRRPAPVVPQNIAAIVVDANSGRVLYAKGEHELRHPASITKVMTLYMLFEQMEKGKFGLDSTIPISSHAAAQPPTRLGLRPGASLLVEDAIKAVVTRSANDIAVAIAEAVGGDEETFAAMMTRKARALGMTQTHFANASGLPDDRQVTTAADLSLLGRAIQDHFPRYYRFFALRSFTYRGVAIRNHNHLLEKVSGMDGIKTGYTRASGFNLLAAVKRGGRHIVAVVMGGRSAGHRDRIMAELIEERIAESERVRAVAAIPVPAEPAPTILASREAGIPIPIPIPAPVPVPVPAAVRPANTAVVASAPDPKLPFVPVTLKPGLTVDTMPLRAGGLAVSPDRPRPAYVAGAPRARSGEAALAPAETIPPRNARDGSTAAATTLVATKVTATPSSVRRPRGLVPPEAIAADPAVEVAVHRSGQGQPADTRPAAVPQGKWSVQIAATNDLAKANDLLARAKQEGRRLLDGATPTTEKIQKGSEILYRARFVGLEADSAESACKTLKRSGFSCFVARN